MKFSFAPLVLITALFTTAFSAPTERGEHFVIVNASTQHEIIHVALSKRYLDFDLSFLNGPISVRSAEPAVDEYRLSKRSVIISFSLAGLNVGVALKRGTEREELSKRNEEYNLVVTSLPPLSAHSRRSSDEYEGRHVVASIRMHFSRTMFRILTSDSRICSGLHGSSSPRDGRIPRQDTRIH